MKITDKMRLRLMIDRPVTFQKYLSGWVLWGFAGCSLIEPLKTKIAALDAAIIYLRAERLNKRKRGGEVNG